MCIASLPSHNMFTNSLRHNNLIFQGLAPLPLRDMYTSVYKTERRLVNTTFYEWLGEYNTPQNMDVICFMSHPYLVSLPFYAIPIFPLLIEIFIYNAIYIDAERQHVCKQHKQPLGITGSGFRLHDLNSDFNGMGSHWYCQAS